MKYVEPGTKHARAAGRALTVSIVSLVSAVCCTVFLPFIISPIALIMSHISKGRTKTRHISAQAATIIAILAIFLNCVIIGWSVYRYNTDSRVKHNVNVAFQQMYGMTVDQYTDQLLKDSGITFLMPEK